MVGDAPLIELVLRKYERPENSDKKALLRMFLLSVGLIQPGDSRDTIVPIFDILMQATKTKESMKVGDICARLEKGAAPSNVRRHLRRLMAIKLVEKADGGYRIAESFDLPLAFKYVTQKYVLSDVLERIEIYAGALKEAYGP